MGAQQPSLLRHHGHGGGGRWWLGLFLAIAAMLVTLANGQSITGVSPTTYTTQGGTTITLTGSNLAATTTITYGPSPNYNLYTAQLVSATATAVRVTTVEGSGSGYYFKIVTSTGGQATGATLTAYMQSTITQIVSGATSMGTVGGTGIIFNGANLGPTGSVISLTYGLSSASPTTYTASSCSVSAAHTQISCSSAAGFGAIMYFRATVGGQVGITSSVTGSYAASTISAVTAASGATMLTTTTNSLTVDGSNFGPGTSSLTLTYYPTVMGALGGLVYTSTSCTASPTTPHTKITCTVPAGVGAAMTWVLTVGDKVGNPITSLTLAYTAPTVSSATPATIATTGGTSMVLNGGNFGPTTTPAAAIVVKYGPGQTLSPASCVVSSASVITCIAAISCGLSSSILLTLGGQSVTLSSTTSWSYAAPTITSFTPAGTISALPTSGGTTVTITGTNLGVSGACVVTASYVGTSGSARTASSCVSTGITTATTIECTTAVGNDRNSVWTVTVGGQSSVASTAMTSYAPPSITSITPYSGLSTSGTDSVLVMGSNMGPSGTPLTLTYGSTPNGGPWTTGTCTVTASTHDRVTCSIPAGIGGSYGVTINSLYQSSAAPTTTATAQIQYAVPTVSTISPSTAFNTAGGGTFTITGTSFGTLASAISVTYGGTSPYRQYVATGCTVPSQTQIVCTMAIGVGSGLRVNVTVGGQSVIATPTLTYGSPTITGASTSTSGILTTTGTTSITLAGTNFGPQNSLTVATYWYSSSIVVYTTGTCTVNALHTQLVCPTVAGVGTNLFWAITIGGQAFSSYPSSISYAVHTVASVATATGTPLGCTGGGSVNIQGTGFGPVGTPNQLYSATYGPVTGTEIAAQFCAASSDSLLVCTAGVGIGANHVWRVTVTGRTVTPVSGTTSYRLPTINGVGPYMSTDGSLDVTIYGDCFGPLSTDPLWSVLPTNYQGTITYGPTGQVTKYAPTPYCTVPYADTRMLCKTVPGVGKDLYFYPTVGGQTSTVTVAGQYEYSRITAISPTTTYSTAGGQTFVLTGTNLGRATDANIVITYGQTSGGDTYTATGCTITTPHTGVTCTTVPGVGNNIGFKATVGGLAGYVSIGLFAYNAPVISAINIATIISTSVATPFTITGTSFGPSGAVPLVTYTSSVSGSAPSYNAASCTVSITDTQITCNTLAGVGKSLQFTVTLALQASNTFLPTGGVSYQVPSVASITYPTNNLGLLTTGNELITIVGSSFGPYGTSYVYYSAKYGPTTATNALTASSCTIVDDQHVTCYSAVGIGGYHQWTLTVGGQSSAPGPTIPVVANSYRLPIVDTITGGPFTTEGGTDVTLTGTNFGPIFSSPEWAALSAQVTATYGPSGNEGKYATSTLCRSYSHTQAVCTTVEGTGGALKWMLNVAGRISVPSTGTMSYIAPLITGIAGSPFPTSGATGIVLTGTNFGTPNIPTVTLGASGTGFTTYGCMVTDHHTATCSIGPGWGMALVMIMTVDGLTGSTSTAQCSYRAPTITSVTGATSMITNGGEYVTLTGDNFGTTTSTAVVTANMIGSDPLYTYNNMACTVITNHTVARCTTAAGIGKTFKWYIKIGQTTNGQLSGASTDTTSYIVPSITGVTLPAIVKTGGADTITVTGNNFGPLAALSVPSGGFSGGSQGGPYTFGSCSMLTPHTQMTCVTPQGVGKEHLVRVILGGQTSDPNGFMTYTPPILSAVQPNLGHISVGTSIQLTGSYFGIPGSVTVNGTTSSTFIFTWGALGSSSGPITATAMSQVSPTQANIMAIIGLQSSATLPFYYFTFYSFSPLYAPIRAGTVITVTGDGFINSGTYQRRFSVTKDDLPSPGTTVILGNYVSAQTLTFTTTATTSGTTGIQASLNADVFITVPGTLTYYDPPSVSSVSPHSGPLEGNTQLTVAGFFPYTGVLLARIGTTAITCTRISSSQLSCVTPSQTVTSYQVLSVTVDLNPADRVWTTDAVYFQYYTTPTVTQLNPPLGLVTGGTVFTLSGLNMIYPTTLDPVYVTFGDNGITDRGSCTLINGGTVTAQCTVPTSASRLTGYQNVQIAINGQQYTNNTVAFLFYAMPTLATISPIFGPMRGGLTWTVTGSGFVPSSYGSFVAAQVYAGSSASVLATATGVYIDAATLQFTAPTFTSLGIGATRIVVTLNNQQYTPLSNSLAYTHYDPPIINAITPRSGPVSGNTSLTIDGQFFRTGATRAIIGGQVVTDCAMDATSSSRIVCRTPSLGGVTGKLAVNISIDTAANAFYQYSIQNLPFYSYPAYTLYGNEPGYALANAGGVVTLDLFASALTDTGTGEAAVRINGQTASAHGPIWHRLYTVTAPASGLTAGYRAVVEIDTATLITAAKMKSTCTDMRWRIHVSATQLGDDLPFAITPATCNTARTRVTLVLPVMTASQVINVAFMYGDASMTTAHIVAPVTVFPLSFDNFVVADPRRWLYATLAPIATFSSTTGMTVSADPTSVGAIITRRVEKYSTGTVFEVSGARWTTTTEPVTGYVQPTIMITSNAVTTFATGTGTTYLTFSMAQTSSCTIATSRQYFWMTLTITSGGAITFETDYCQSQTATLPAAMISGGFYLSLASIRSSVTRTTLFNWFTARTIATPPTLPSSPPAETNWLRYISCTVPSLVAGSYPIQLALNGIDFPSDQLLFASNARTLVVHAPVTLSSVTPSVSNIDLAIPVTVAGDWSSLSSNISFRLGPNDQFSKPYSYGTNTATFMYTGVIPTGGSVALERGSHVVQSTLNNGQQVMSTAAVTFNKVNELCNIAHAEAEAMTLAEIQALTPDLQLTESMIVTTTSWDIISGGATSTVCGSPRAGGTLSFVFDGVGERILQSAAVDTTFGGTLSFSIHYGGASTTCRGATAGSSVSTVELQFTNNGGATWNVLQSVSSTLDQWIPTTVTLPMIAQADGGLTKFRFYQAAVSGTDLRGIFALQLVQLAVYPPTSPTLQVYTYRPHGGPAAGGTVVTVFGEGFDSISALACSFGAIAARTFVRVNSTLALCVTAPIVLTSARLAPTSFSLCGARVYDSRPFTFYSDSALMMTTQGLYSEDNIQGVTPYITLTGDSFYNTDEAKVRYTTATGTVVQYTGEPILVDDVYWQWPIGDAVIRPTWPFSNGARAMKAHWMVTPTQLEVMGVGSEQQLTAIDLYIAIQPNTTIYNLQINMAELSGLSQGFSGITNIVFAARNFQPSDLPVGWKRFVFDSPWPITGGTNYMVFELSTAVGSASTTLGVGGALGIRHGFTTIGYRWSGASNSLYPFDGDMTDTDFKADSIVPRLRLVVSGTVMSRYVLRTPAPFFADVMPTAGVVTTTVALNGQKWVTASLDTLGANPFQWATYSPSDLAIATILPPFGPVTGNTIVDIQGTGFPTNGGVFVARWRQLKSLPVCNGTEQLAGTCLYANDPAYLAADRASEYIACKLMDTTGTTMQCEGTPAQIAGLVVMEISVNGAVDWAVQLSLNRFVFYEAAVLTSVTPIEGPAAGGTVITIDGENFFVPPEEVKRYIGALSFVRCLIFKTQLTKDATLTQDEQNRFIMQGHLDEDTGLITCTTSARPANTDYYLYVSFNGAKENLFDNYNGAASTVGLPYRYLPCAVGRFTPDYMTACTDCPVGKFSAETDAAACTNCIPGFYQSLTGQASCVGCPLGSTTQEPFLMSQVLANDSASFDNPVAPSFRSGASSINDCTCRPGYYANLPLTYRLGQVSCQKCEPPNLDGAVCPGSVSDIDGSHVQPWPATGSYMLTTNPNISQVYIVKCDPPAACFGGPQSLCNTGYTGVTCGECVFGYYPDTKQCLECPAFRWWTLVILGIVVLGAVAVFLSISPWVKGLASLRILYNFLQFSYRLRFFRVAWPAFVLTFFNYVSYIVPNIDFLRPECQIPISTIGKFLVIQLTPVILLLIILVLYWLQRRELGAALQRQVDYLTKNVPLRGSVGNTWTMGLKRACCHPFVIAHRLWWFILWVTLAACTVAVNIVLRIFECCEPEYDPDQGYTDSVDEVDATGPLPSPCPCTKAACKQRCGSCWGRICSGHCCCQSCGGRSRKYGATGRLASQSVVGAPGWSTDTELLHGRSRGTGTMVGSISFGPGAAAAANLGATMMFSSPSGSANGGNGLTASGKAAEQAYQDSVAARNLTSGMAVSDEWDNEPAPKLPLRGRCTTWCAAARCRRWLCCCCRPAPRVIDSETEALRIRTRFAVPNFGYRRSGQDLHQLLRAQTVFYDDEKLHQLIDSDDQKKQHREEAKASAAEVKDMMASPNSRVRGQKGSHGSFPASPHRGHGHSSGGGSIGAMPNRTTSTASAAGGHHGHVEPTVQLDGDGRPLAPPSLRNCWNCCRRTVEPQPSSLYHPSYSRVVLQHEFLASQKGHDHEYLRNITHQILHLAHEKLLLDKAPATRKEAEVVYDRKKDDLWDLTINALTMLMQFAHLTLLQNALQVFPCRSLTEDVRVLSFYSNVTCNSSDHWWLKTLAGLFLALWSFGIPIIFMGYLWFQHVTGNLYSLQARSRYGYLILRYAERNWFWEWVILARKTVMVFLVVYLASVDQKFEQIAWAFFMVFAFFGLQMVRDPFVEEHLNWQESIALLNHVVAFFIGLLYVSAESSGSSPPNDVLGVALILFIFVTGLWLLKYTIREIRQSLSMIKVFFTKKYLATSLAFIFSSDLVEDDPLSKQKLKQGPFGAEHARRIERLRVRLSMLPLLSEPYGVIAAHHFVKDLNTPTRDISNWVRFLEDIVKSRMEIAFGIAPTPNSLLRREAVQRAKQACVRDTLVIAQRFLTDTFCAPKVCYSDDINGVRKCAVVDSDGILRVYAVSTAAGGNGMHLLVGEVKLRRSRGTNIHAGGVVGHTWQYAGEVDETKDAARAHAGAGAFNITEDDEKTGGAGGVKLLPHPPRPELKFDKGNHRSAPSSMVSCLSFSATATHIGIGWLDGHLSIVNIHALRDNDTGVETIIPLPTESKSFGPPVGVTFNNDECLNIHGALSDDKQAPSHVIEHIVGIGQYFITGSSDKTFAIIPLVKDPFSTRTILSSSRPQPSISPPTLASLVPRAAITALHALPANVNDATSVPRVVIATADGRLQSWSWSHATAGTLTQLNSLESPTEFRAGADSTSTAHTCEITGVTGNNERLVSYAEDGSIRVWMHNSYAVPGVEALSSAIPRDGVISAISSVSIVPNVHGDASSGVVVGREDGSVSLLRNSLPVDGQQELIAPPQEIDTSVVAGVRDVPEPVKQVICLPHAPMVAILYRSCVRVVPLPDITGTVPSSTYPSRAAYVHKVLFVEAKMISPHEIRDRAAPGSHAALVVPVAGPVEPKVLQKAIGLQRMILIGNNLAITRSDGRVSFVDAVSLADQNMDIIVKTPEFFTHHLIGAETRCFGAALAARAIFEAPPIDGTPIVNSAGVTQKYGKPGTGLRYWALRTMALIPVMPQPMQQSDRIGNSSNPNSRSGTVKKPATLSSGPSTPASGSATKAVPSPIASVRPSPVAPTVRMTDDSI